jgi:hypothetical protein
VIDPLSVAVVGVTLVERTRRVVRFTSLGRKVADKAVSATSPEEVTGLITGAIAAA